MSAYTIERVLWEVCCMPDKTAAFKSDPVSHLSGYPLSESERDIVQHLRVREMADLGVSQMLLMMTWNIMVGPDKIGEYMGRMNRAA